MNTYRKEAVASKLNCALSTLLSWYKWKKLYPNHELAKLLPEPNREGRVLVWTEDDIEQLKLFQSSIPHGRGGILGDITQKYWRGRKANNGKKN